MTKIAPNPSCNEGNLGIQDPLHYFIPYKDLSTDHGLFIKSSTCVFSVLNLSPLGIILDRCHSYMLYQRSTLSGSWFPYKTSFNYFVTQHYWLIQHQILQTNIIRILWQTVRRISNEILGVQRLRH